MDIMDSFLSFLYSFYAQCARIIFKNVIKTEVILNNKLTKMYCTQKYSIDISYTEIYIHAEKTFLLSGECIWNQRIHLKCIAHQME